MRLSVSALRCLVRRPFVYSRRNLCGVNGRLEVRPEPRPESRPEPGPESRPESRPESKPESKPESRPEPRPESGPEPGVLVLASNPRLLLRLSSQVEVRPGFITEEEEAALMKELEPGLRRKRYEFDHWDNAIHGYRETERVSWGSACAEVLNRVRSVSFPSDSALLGPVHVLDLDKKGYIKPHIDSVKFCGSTIAGLSLLSNSVMRLVKQNFPDERLELLLPQNSLYIIRDEARYQFTHEILKDEESLFNGQRVPRQRRISVICRNLPS